MSSSIFFFLRLDLSLNLELASSSRLSVQQAPGVIRSPSPLPSPALRLQAHGASPSFSLSCGDLVTGPLFFTISTLLTEPPPQSRARFFLVALCSTFSLNINFCILLDTRIVVGISLCSVAIGLWNPLKKFGLVPESISASGRWTLLLLSFYISTVSQGT